MKEGLGGRGMGRQFARGGGVSLKLGLWSAKDALCLLHFRATVAGVVHLQTVI